MALNSAKETAWGACGETSSTLKEQDEGRHGICILKLDFHFSRTKGSCEVHEEDRAIIEDDNRNHGKASKQTGRQAITQAKKQTNNDGLFAQKGKRDKVIYV
ncbi:uncharacterized protein [Montipora capricornis]|uniref:uncharacterized protein n=1 Tax=Montipora capricornis TaxID=246305 RepID=UPI0035F14687